MLVHLVTDSFSTGGGLEHIFQIVQGLPHLDFRVFANPGTAVDKFSGLPNVEVLPGGYSPALVFRAKPDLIHIHHLLPLVAFFRNPLVRYGTPVLYTAHGLHIHKYEFAGGAAGRLKYGMRFALEKYLFARADRVIAVSREDAEFIAGNYGVRQVEHIPNGIDPSRLEPLCPQKEEFASEFLLPQPNILFVTVARFDFQKGYDILVRAIAMARDLLEEKNARFLLVGEGETLPGMKKLADRLRVSHLAHFLGRLPEPQRLMRSADFFLLPSRWEGLPLVLLEAGLLKVPVIASDACGNRELLAGGRGILFANENASDLAEKLRQAIRGEFDLQRQSQTLYQAIQKDYSVAGMLSRLQDAYAAVASEKNGQREN